MITRTKALKLLRKEYPHGATIKENPRAPSTEEKKVLLAKLIEHRKTRPTPPPPTPEYLAYLASLKCHRAEENRLQSLCLTDRWNASLDTGSWIGRAAGGDTLEALLKSAGVKIPEEEAEPYDGGRDPAVDPKIARDGE